MPGHVPVLKEEAVQLLLTDPNGTYVDATYSDAYLTCVAAPCVRPTVPVPAGNRLPGVPRNNAFAALRCGSDLGPRAA